MLAGSDGIMTAILPNQPIGNPIANQQKQNIFYESEDGKPLAETYDHLYAILTTLEVLKQYLTGKQATVLSNQFLYYVQNFPKLRIASDLMVIFDVPPGGRDNYKIWEEGRVPAVIFEMTSPGTRLEDQSFKKDLYEGLGVQEYWLFDPKGEWIEQKLLGYRLRGEIYEPITDGCSEPLQLRLAVEGKLIGFYQLDTGQKLLIPEELALALRAETVARTQAEERAQQAEAKVSEMEALLAQYRDRFGALPVD
jgi:Uma2 family endonuclease